MMCIVNFIIKESKREKTNICGQTRIATKPTHREVEEKRTNQHLNAIPVIVQKFRFSLSKLEQAS